VVTRADRRGEPELVAYLVPAGGPPPSVGALRRLLAETLPDYMLPAVFVVLDAFRVTVPLPALLEASTVAEMAVVIAEHMAGKADRYIDARPALTPGGQEVIAGSGYVPLRRE